MGTSTSSKGPGAGVPLDPAWLDDVVPEDDGNNTVDILSQSRRFSQARRYMSDYTRTGSEDDLRKSLGHYSRSGMSGSKYVSHRMRLSTSVGSKLYDALHSTRDDEASELFKKIDEFKKNGASAERIIDLIARYTCPNGGSLDEISTVNSTTSALAQLLKKYPEIDFQNLSDDQIWELMGLYLGNEVFSRIQMDIGQTFEKNDVSVTDRVLKMNKMRSFIQIEISVQLNKVRAENKSPISIDQILEKTIQELFYIYGVEV